MRTRTLALLTASIALSLGAPSVATAKVHRCPHHRPAGTNCGLHKGRGKGHHGKAKGHGKSHGNNGKGHGNGNGKGHGNGNGKGNGNGNGNGNGKGHGKG